MASEGCNRLFREMDERMQDYGDRPPVMDFGVIQGDMSLLTNYFPQPIPQADYTVCRSVQWGKIDDIFYRTQDKGRENSGEHPHLDGGEHGHPPPLAATSDTHTHEENAEKEHHIHDTLIGPKFRWLMPGDRVLVAWVGVNDDDHEAVVIDLIYPATRIGRDADGYDK